MENLCEYDRLFFTVRSNGRLEKTRAIHQKLKDYLEKDHPKLFNEWLETQIRFYEYQIALMTTYNSELSAELKALIEMPDTELPPSAPILPSIPTPLSIQA